MVYQWFRNGPATEKPVGIVSNRHRSTGSGKKLYTSNSSKYDILTSDKDFSLVVFCEYGIFIG